MDLKIPQKFKISKNNQTNLCINQKADLTGILSKAPLKYMDKANLVCLMHI